jgi:hypothetical protein
MKKWVGPFFTILLVTILISISGPFNIFKQMISKGEKVEEHRIVLTQDSSKEGKKEESDSHLILILKELQQMIDGWLKSLNEQIEREDITRFKVRFLEILRNILEWVKEKIDAKIESSKEQNRQRKERGGPFRETHQRVSPFFEIG